MRTGLTSLIVSSRLGILDDLGVWRHKPIAWGNSTGVVNGDTKRGCFDLWALIIVSRSSSASRFLVLGHTVTKLVRSESSLNPKSRAACTFLVPTMKKSARKKNARTLQNVVENEVIVQPLGARNIEW